MYVCIRMIPSPAKHKQQIRSHRKKVDVCSFLNVLNVKRAMQELNPVAVNGQICPAPQKS